jgi:Family of unknown function (DUF6526)
MSQTTPQTYENHTRFVPAYHMVLSGILMINLGWSVYQAFHAPSVGAVVSLLLAVGLLMLAFFARIFALTVQDRVIRLEMRLRMGQVLPPDLRGRILEFSRGQLVALRFASDEELPELARKVLAEKIEEGKAIKKMIKHWNPDYLRA